MSYVIAVLAVLLALLLLGMVLAVRRRRLFRAAGYTVSASFVIVCALAISALSMNLHTYRQLTLEIPVIDVTFDQLADQRYAATLQLPDGNQIRTELAGDEWQLDARMLKWSGLATVLGMQPLYRLERLSGRYLDLAEETGAARTVYQLGDNRGLDLWATTRSLPGGLPWVDAVYGTATYLPMRNRAHYRVSITASGLLARAVNPQATDAIANWE